MSIKPPERVVHETTSHPAIFEKIKQRNPEGASRKFREHLEEILPLLQTLEKKLPKKPLH